MPGETRRFSFIFKSERAGIFSEPWEFRTHPLLLGGALLQVTLWGIAVYEDKLADFRGKLEVTEHVAGKLSFDLYMQIEDKGGSGQHAIFTVQLLLRVGFTECLYIFEQVC